MENERLLRKHREEIIKDSPFKDFKLDDFTLRSPESLRDNPFMRFIGFQYPVKIYRDVVYVREHKVLKYMSRGGGGNNNNVRNRKPSHVSSSDTSSN